MSPLAGKPPFATDDPDAFFDNQAKHIPAPRKRPVDDTAPGGPRESAYNTYDSYFTGNPANPRASGVGDIGRGLMNADSDFDDSSDDEQQSTKKQGRVMVEHSSDKHRALFEAATAEHKRSPPPPSYAPQVASISQNELAQPQAQQTMHLRVVKQSQPMPHARGNEQWLLSQHAEPSTPPGTFVRSMAYEQRAPDMQPLVAPAPAHSRPPQPAFMQSRMHVPPNSSSPYLVGSLPDTPSPRTPQPLPPPQTPILPVFARPRQPTNITFDEKSAILRGNSEETLLPRGAGGKGDEFWRRFSMVAKEEAKSGSKSAWLRKTESGSTRLAAWAWMVGVLILIAIGGSIGVGWFFTHNKPTSQPVAIGGSAEQAGAISSSSSVVSTASFKPTKVTAAPVPTNTANNNQKRYIEKLVPLSPLSNIIPAGHRRSLVNRLH